MEGLARFFGIRHDPVHAQGHPHIPKERVEDIRAVLVPNATIERFEVGPGGRYVKPGIDVQVRSVTGERHRVADDLAEADGVVDAGNQELCRSNRVGKWDFGMTIFK